MNSDSSHPNTLASLLRELRDESLTLVRQEMDLAKAEMKENVSQLANHTMHIAIGGFVSYAGVIVLLIGIGLLIGSLLVRAGLDRDIAQWLAPSVVGGVVALIGLGMVAKAKKAIASEDVVPKRTIKTMRENKNWAENKLQHS